VYGFVGRWVPKGLVAWMMGVRKVGGGEEKEFGRGMEIVATGSRATSPGSSGGSMTYSAANLGMDESEYISVYGMKGLQVEHEHDDGCDHHH